jgi:Ca-activated chloride channel family protein
MKFRSIVFCLSIVASMMGPVIPAYADGIIIPEPPVCEFGPCPDPFPISQLAIEYHHVDVLIQDQVAVTHVDQVFRNENDWPVEGTYVFPLPEGAAVTEFILWIDGEPVQGEVLTREEARQVYEDIVRTMRDPALLEYVDRGAVRASIFPIPPGGERRIELEYTQVLQAENGLVHYNYPLNTEKFSTQPLENVTISVQVQSSDPLQAVYSPSHPIAIDREDDHEFTAGYEDSNVTPDTDFELYYSVSDFEVGLNLLTYRDPLGDDDDGFFLLMAAPGVEVDENQRVAKDVIVVLDRSGSMEGDKFQQAQEALHYVIDHLNQEDRFNIIAFSTGLRSFADELQPLSQTDQAHRWVDGLSAAGSTDINLALSAALSQLEDSNRPAFVLFLTDGLPTEGEVDPAIILRNLEQQAPDNVRLFSFGVGYDVDTFLLDSLSEQHHGSTTYVTPGQAIDEAVSGFYAKVSTPVLTDIELDFGDMVVYDLYPEPLPDLFAGTQLVLVGRYNDWGGGPITLSGQVDGQTQTVRYEDQTFRRSGGPDFLPRLWATRKIGYLLKQVRLHGADEELVEQIVALSIRYGIVTEYTSYLVTEPGMVINQGWDDVVEEAMDQMSEPAESFGEGAVDRAATEAELSGADMAAPGSYEDATGQSLVRTAGTRTFRWAEGVWVDTHYASGQETTRVPFLSEAYFELASADAELGAALALGQAVIVVYGDTAYEIVDAEANGDPVNLPQVEPVESDSETPSPTVIVPQEEIPWGWIGGGLVMTAAVGLVLLVWKTRP